MNYDKRNEINFNNIKLFLEAVDLTNDENILNNIRQNDFICYFLSTGDLSCFCKEGKKILKRINFEELILDIEATLLLHDSIKPLLNSNIVKMYNSDYWKMLYDNMPSTIDGYEKFFERFKYNFNMLIDMQLISVNNIIYSFLIDTLNYIEQISQNISNNDALEEYNRAMVIPSILLEEKNMLEKSKTKHLFMKRKKNIK